ncbi:MAG TPA: sensor domain-containing diguanylate cyclase, partial [Candidatus Udaeobacter sp.]|nr:sensor domain-containing diguanylate cyclase [Candidatus Udaeobacter sp.]
MPSEQELLEWMPDGIVVCDGTGRITFVNREAETMTGYGRDELLGRKVELLVPPSLCAGHIARRRNFYREARAREMGRPDADFKLRRKDGAVVPVDIALGPVGSHTVAVLRDMTDRRTMEEALEHRALHDPLTELANRSLFFDRLRQSIHAARREDERVALVMLDIDGFKEINDVRGHAVGDQVLKELGVRLGSGLRATDTAARIGGDEFAWILPRVSSRESAHRTVVKRLAHVQEPIMIHGRELQIAISAGIAVYPDDGHDPDTLMRHAD